MAEKSLIVDISSAFGAVGKLLNLGRLSGYHVCYVVTSSTTELRTNEKGAWLYIGPYTFPVQLKRLPPH